MHTPLYPEWLEIYWKTLALKTLARPAESEEESLRRLEGPIQALSDLFTTARPSNFTDYTQGLPLLAYGLFFFPQTFARIRFPLAEVIDLRGWLPAEASTSLRILDLGAGLGAAGLSAALLLQKRFNKPIHLTALDHSPTALHALETLFEANSTALASITLHAKAANLKDAPKLLAGAPAFDLIVCSFALNEAFTEASTSAKEAYLTSLKPLLNKTSLLLILEPALRATAITLQSLADDLVSAGTFNRLGPGIHPAPYPQLNSDLKYAPHEVRSWTPPESLAFLNRRLFRSIGELKFHFAALSPSTFAEPVTGSAYTCRLTSPMSLLKGQFAWTGLGSDGQRYTYDLPARGLDKITLKTLATIERGDILTFATLLPLKTANHFRVASPADILHTYSANPR